MKFFYWLYLLKMRLLSQSRVLNWVGVSKIRIDAFRNSNFRSKPFSGGESVAFHAASAGELEILIPVISAFRERGMKIVVTIFSESAWNVLQKITGLEYAGLSPREDEWATFFTCFNVQKVFVSKYEAWPALWIECQKRKMPLILINAQWRTSLAWAKRFLSFFGFPSPRLFLFTTEEAEVTRLQNHFPQANVFCSADPRWLRVNQRKINSAQNAKVNEWKKSYAHAVPPFGVVGSAWLEDLRVLIPALKAQAFAGTLWVVPHSLQSENLSEIQKYLQEKLPGQFVLVNEMGILAELYSIATWAWVGGGFGKGVHSTMEPAVYGFPIACGPARALEFPEVRELIQAEALTLCSNANEAENWLKTLAIRPKQTESSFIQKKIADLPQSIEQWLQIR